MPIWRVVLKQEMPVALHLALERAGKSMAARIAIIAMTTRSSIRVKPTRFLRIELFMGFVVTSIVAWDHRVAYRKHGLFAGQGWPGGLPAGRTILAPTHSCFYGQDLMLN